MATSGNRKALTGLIGNVVFRTVNGKAIVQSRPANIKQTTATKKSASEFGSCSRWAKQLRMGLQPLLVGMTDSTMHSRFSTQLYNAIKSNTAVPQGQRTPLNSAMDALVGFEFNTHSPFATHFSPTIITELTSANELIISISAFDPKTDMLFPTGCHSAKLVVYVLTSDCLEGSRSLEFHALLTIEKNTPINAQTLLTTAPIPTGQLVLATAKLLYFTPNPLTESNYLNTKVLSPAMVVSVVKTGL